MIRLTFAIIFTFCFGTIDAYTQNTSLPKRPNKGELMPDFVFTDIDGKPGKSIKLSDFRGQHVILDFWDLGCPSCINSFKKMDSLDRARKGKLKVIMVGLNNKKNNKEGRLGIKKSYERFKKNLNLQFLSVFDTAAAQVMGVMVLPSLIWIDDKGVFKGKTGSIGTPENIENFLSNKINLIDIEQSSLGKSGYKPHPSLKVSNDHKKPLGASGNGVYDENDFKFRSVLYEWKNGMPSIFGGEINLKDDERGRGSFESIRKNKLDFKTEYLGVRPNFLYYVAALGNSSSDQSDWYPELFFDVKDKEKAMKIFDGDRIYGEVDLEDQLSNRFSYSLIISYEVAKDKNPAAVRKYMMQDLERYFGYTVVVQPILGDCWVLKIDSSVQNVKSFKYIEKEGTGWANDASARFTGRFILKKYSIVHLLGSLQKLIKTDPRHRLQNGTNLPDDYMIDIELDLNVGRTNSIEKVNQELSKYGLKFVMEKRPLKMLIFKDAD